MLTLPMVRPLTEKAQPTTVTTTITTQHPPIEPSPQCVSCRVWLPGKANGVEESAASCNASHGSEITPTDTKHQNAFKTID